MISKKIAKKVVELRKKCNWSQSELARRVDCTSAAISLIEKGNRVPTLEILINFAEVFNVSLCEIIGESIFPSHSSEEERVFFRKFGSINALNKFDQNILLKIADRLGMR